MDRALVLVSAAALLAASCCGGQVRFDLDGAASATDSGGLQALPEPCSPMDLTVLETCEPGDVLWSVEGVGRTIAPGANGMVFTTKDSSYGTVLTGVCPDGEIAWSRLAPGAEWQGPMATDLRGNVYLPDRSGAADGFASYDSYGSLRWHRHAEHCVWPWIPRPSLYLQEPIYVGGCALDTSGHVLWDVYDHYPSAAIFSGQVGVTFYSSLFMAALYASEGSVRLDSFDTSTWNLRGSALISSELEAAFCRPFEIDANGNTYIFLNYRDEDDSQDQLLKVDPHGDQVWRATFDCPQTWEGCTLIAAADGTLAMPDWSEDHWDLCGYSTDGDNLWCTEILGPRGDRNYDIYLELDGIAIVGDIGGTDPRSHQWIGIDMHSGEELWRFELGGFDLSYGGYQLSSDRTLIIGSHPNDLILNVCLGSRG
jgi:outer membrane protein assembly factor BamB